MGKGLYVMLNYNEIEAVLFDMDGTIFDSETVHREAWKITAGQFGQVFTNDMYLQFIGVTTPDCMKLAVNMFDHAFELEQFSPCYYDNLKTLAQTAVPLKQGFQAYLNKLKLLNKPLGLVTSSGQSGVESNFAHYDFLDDFTVIISRDDVSHFKPHPEPYLKACQKLGVQPSKTLVFEDSNTGATAAIEAGCVTVGIPDLMPFNEDVAKRLSLNLKSFEALL
ncbi:HAD family hydrolase [Thalassotalea euphylliae]|uniref:HAD family hydrolase n=1 Tax=Thalassotalea euphylliae TaxID=1655234 RepID=UPI003636D306